MAHTWLGPFGVRNQKAVMAPRQAMRTTQTGNVVAIGKQKWVEDRRPSDANYFGPEPDLNAAAVDGLELTASEL